MQLLFVSSTTVGGSGRSQRELAAQLEAMGHSVTLLVDDDSPAPLTRWVHEQLSDAAERFGSGPGGGVLRWLEQRPGRRSHTRMIDGRAHEASPVPQNALDALLATTRPDVIVGNSLVRLSWRRVCAAADRRGLPTVLYVRETASLDHLLEAAIPGLVLANARSLVAEIEGRGTACTFIPSVVDLTRTQCTSTRQVALAINPIGSHGRETMLELARRLPDIPFALQESWPLDAGSVASLTADIAELPNVTFRRAEPPGPRLYSDARVLLVPHRIDNRPRVIAEAQYNGIPVLGSATPGIVEAMGAGGVAIHMDDLDRWVAEVRSLWTDEDRYSALCEQAKANATNAENRPRAVAERFVAALSSLLA